MTLDEIREQHRAILEERRKLSGGKKQKRPRLPPCADLSRELLAGEVAALNLDTRCRWFACKTGEHPAHTPCRGEKPKSGPLPG